MKVFSQLISTPKLDISHPISMLKLGLSQTMTTLKLTRCQPR